MTVWAKHQPKDGDRLLLCPHSDEATYHWFRCEDPMKISRSDGTEVVVHWIVACSGCFQEADGDPWDIAYDKDARWNGDVPIIPSPN